MLIIQTLLLSSLPAAALLVITTQSPVISVLALVMFTTLLACLLFLQGFSFVSLLYIVVYVGAVAILFIFVIMIIDVRESEITHTGKSYTNFVPLTFSVATLAFFSFERCQGIDTKIFSHSTVYTLSDIQAFFLSDIQAFALAFYGYSAFHFIIISFLLLTAIIGPISLCMQANRQS